MPLEQRTLTRILERNANENKNSEITLLFYIKYDVLSIDFENDSFLIPHLRLVI